MGKCNYKKLICKVGVFDRKMKIFDRFYSLRDEIDDTKTHSGLGLNIAKQIIDAHQGYISANNIEDNNGIIGARFIINLPIAK